MTPRTSTLSRLLRVLTMLLLFSMLLALRTMDRPAAAASITISPGSGAPGTQVKVKGTGFPVGLSGTIYWDSQGGTQIGTFTTDSNGAFSKKVKFPESASPGGHVIWACTIPKLLVTKPVCASRSVKVTEAPEVTVVPATRAVPTPERTDCDRRGLAGEFVINFESYAVGTELRGTTSPEGVRFLGDGGTRVIAPAVGTHSGSRALSLDYPGEFGSAGVPMRIGFTSLQDFVGMYVGLNERIWSSSPITAVLTAYSLDAAGNRIVAGTDSETFGPSATPIRKCMSVIAPEIFEVSLDYGSVGEPEVIDDLTLRGPATPVPLPEDDSPPRITVLLPEAGSTVAEASVRLQGEVREDRELVSMNFQLRAGSFHDLAFTPAGVTPEGERLYLFAVDPIPTSELRTCGANTIQVRARDSSDNLGAADVDFEFYAGDLAVTEVEAVQVVYGADLVSGKSTAFRALVDSSFDCPVETMFKLELLEEEWATGPVRTGAYHIGLPADWEYPEEWGPVVIPSHASDHTVMLPYIQPGQETIAFDSDSQAGVVEGRDVRGVEGPDIRVVPRPKSDQASFAVVVDPENSVPEQNEANNRRESPTYNVVTTRSMCFFVVPIQADGTGPRTSALNIKSQVEFILGTFPLADSKVSWKTALVNAQTCPDDASQDCNWAISNSGDFLGTAATMARASGCDYAIAIGPWGGGSTPAGFTGGATIGHWGGEALLAHEFNHSMTSVLDVYSLDCLVGWDEFYCEYPDGHREYYCQDDELELVDGYTGLTCRYEAGEVTCEERTKECVMYTGCSAYRRNDACAPTEVPTCDRACAEATVIPECAGCVGYWSGPDCRIFHPSSEGFWVNRWQVRDSSYAYIADCGGGARWMRLDNTIDHCHTRAAFADGYRNMLRSPNFVTGVDPEALLVRGVIYKSGKAELQPFIYLPQANLDRAPEAPGTYRFVSYDDQGEMLGTTGFDVTFEGTGEKAGPLDRTYFVMRIQWNPATRRIALQDESGAVLAERLVSEHAPEIEITSPVGGESWPRDLRRTIRWTATDADGDALTYLVDLSPDAGETWWPVAIDLTEQEYRMDISQLEEGAAYLVRVRATDGVNTGEAISAEAVRIIAAGPAVSQTLLWSGIGVLAVLGLGMILAAWLWSRRRGLPKP
jgi:hypothetical protein